MEMNGSLGADPWMAVSELPMSGRYMIQNAMVLWHLSSGSVLIRRFLSCLREYAGLPHRMVERVPVNGVRFINDSKGTNVGALVTAISSMKQTVICTCLPAVKAKVPILVSGQKRFASIVITYLLLDGRQRLLMCWEIRPLRYGTRHSLWLSNKLLPVMLCC